MGAGLIGVRLEGMIGTRHLEAVLLGRNPITGDQLLTTNGSAQRAQADEPRPRDETQRERWNEAARRIEPWRHAELGLGPPDGPMGDDGLSAALGPAPAEPALAMRRDLAIRQLPVEFQPQRTAERAIDGPALTID